MLVQAGRDFMKLLLNVEKGSAFFSNCLFQIYSATLIQVNFKESLAAELNLVKLLNSFEILFEITLKSTFKSRKLDIFSRKCALSSHFLKKSMRGSETYLSHSIPPT